MNIRNLITAAILMTTVATGIAAESLSKKNVNTFQSPDFAFPQKVEQNAEKAMKTAAAAGDHAAQLRAAMQITIARDLRSNADFTRGTALFDSLGNTLPAPYSQLAYLLEATVYTQAYNADKWTYDRRTLPADSVPESPMAWDGAMFRAKIKSLVAKTLADPTAGVSTSLADIKPIITDYEDAVKAGFTVADFIDGRAFELLQDISQSGDRETIPFGPADTVSTRNLNSLSDMAAEAIDRAIARHENDADPRGLAYLYLVRGQRLPSYAQESYWEKAMKRFSDTPYCVRFIINYCDRISADRNGEDVSDDVKRRCLAIYDDYIARYPNGENIDMLKNARERILTKNISVTLPNITLPNKEIEAKVSATNLYDFYALLYSVPYSLVSNGRFVLKNLQKSAKLVRSIPVKVNGVSPAKVDTTLMLEGLAPGAYIILNSTRPSASGIFDYDKDSWKPVMLVSNLDWTALERKDGEGMRLYVADASNGAPVKNLEVKFYKRVGRDRKLTGTARTDSDGACDVADASPSYRDYEFEAERDGNLLKGSFYTVRHEEERVNDHKFAEVLTDLSLYRPGQEVEFTAVCYKNRRRVLSPLAGDSVKATLRDANYKQIKTWEGKTDEFGRAVGKFTIPTDGLLGNYSILFWADGKTIGSEHFEVAEYKAPTFYVETSGVDGSVNPGDTVTVKGKAMTYSGMPVADAKVSYLVSYRRPWWRWSYNDNATYGGETVTGADGSFDIRLETAGLQGTTFEDGSFTIAVTVTDAAGETRKAPEVWFSTREAYSIRSNIPAEYEVAADGNASFSVNVSDASGRPAVKQVYYRILRDGKSVASGEFTSPKLDIDLSQLPSGTYEMELSLLPDFKATDEMPSNKKKVVIFRAADKEPPVETPLWVSADRVVVPAGEKTVKISVGGSYPDNYVLAEIMRDSKLLETRWVKLYRGFTELAVPAPKEDERVYVELFAMRDFKQKFQEVTLVPKVQTEQLKIETETFRDRIEPGARETWKFRFEIEGRPMAGIPVLAVMSDKALNSINPFRWSLNPEEKIGWSHFYRRQSLNTSKVTYSNSISEWTRSRNEKEFMFPAFDTYGYPFYSGTDYGVMLECMSVGAAPKVTRSMKMAAMTNAAVSDMAMLEEEHTEAAAETPAAGTDAGDQPAAPDIQLRETDQPLAFFMPKLVTDRQGVATVEFDAPQFVGTWQFQIAGYSKDMKGAVSVLDAVSAKKVMAQLNAPRFLRTGDKASVSATLYNNSDAAAPVSGRIDFFDPATGSIVASREFAAEQVQASGSRVVTIEYDVTAESSALGIRAYAMTDGASDGEQTVIPVYPSSTPVTESTTFYLAPGAAEKSVTLPKYGKEAQVTLQYCDNPVWECVTALPDILEPKSVNTLAQIYALYGNAVAAGICRDYPDVAEAIREMASPENAADSTLVSNLEKNQQLKTVLLNNTPWVNNAAAETMRMSRLVEYTDSEKAQTAVKRIMENLRKTQLGDGGWSWCPEMKSSTYITGRVLLYFSMLKKMGYLPDGAEEMAKKAFAFCDKQLTEAWIESGRRSGKRHFSETELQNYLYVKSAFPSMKATNGFGALEKEAMSAIKKNWKSCSIYDKATRATLLFRKGDTSLATLILESLRQLALTDPEKGMWFDNLNSGWGGFNKLITTAQALEAFAEVEPNAPAVDGLRQWLVLSKQTEEWGDNRNTCEVIHAILTTGTKWNVPSEPPVVTLAGERIEPGHIAKLTGSFTVTLDASKASGRKLVIEKKSEGPSWGGVIQQYVAPILSVKEASVPELKVTKAVYAVNADGKATAGRIKKGDRIRVTLTIVADKDMDYVAVTDSRAACLEPAEQLSGYTASDGMWFYREVRNDATNLFIPFLAKGTHVVTYDCFADRDGEYSLGIATAQSQYAPVIVAHSAGAEIIVK